MKPTETVVRIALDVERESKAHLRRQRRRLVEFLHLMVLWGLFLSIVAGWAFLFYLAGWSVGWWR